jgi:hypothetical protein
MSISLHSRDPTEILWSLMVREGVFKLTSFQAKALILQGI